MKTFNRGNLLEGSNYLAEVSLGGSGLALYTNRIPDTKTRAGSGQLLKFG